MLASREKLVGVRGFEPPAPASRKQCSTRLSYTPPTGASYSEKRASKQYMGALRGKTRQNRAQETTPHHSDKRSTACIVFRFQYVINEERV